MSSPLRGSSHVDTSGEVHVLAEEVAPFVLPRSVMTVGLRSIAPDPPPTQPAVAAPVC